MKAGASVEGLQMPTGFIPSHDASGPHHIAFALEKGTEEQWRQHLATLAVPIDSTVDWPEGGRSFYFRDPDGHLLELITPKQWKFQPWPPIQQQ